MMSKDTEQQSCDYPVHHVVSRGANMTLTPILSLQAFVGWYSLAVSLTWG